MQSDKNTQSQKDLFSTLELNKKVNIENWLTSLGVDSKTLSKEKDQLLDQEVYFSDQTVINYSGSWGVPNPTQTITYFLDEKNSNKEDIKNLLKEKKSKEKEHRKIQKKSQESHDFRFQRPSDVKTEYGTTTLRKMLKKFDERPKSHRSSLSSSTFEYKIQKIS